MTRYEERLEAKLRARNRLHTEAKRWLAISKAALPAWVGKPIQNTGGDLKKKFKDSLPDLPNSVELSLRVSSSAYTLRLEVRTCEMIRNDCGCVYQDDSFSLGDIDAGVLQKIVPCHEQPPLRSDFDREEVESVRRHLEQVEDHARNLRGSPQIQFFGTHDNF